MSEIYSNCCNATAGVKTDYREGTSYHYCKKCGEPCDVYDHSSNLTYEELESKSQILEAENEALKAELADANAHAADFAADCDRLEKELAIKNDALSAALLTAEHLNKELAELKSELEAVKAERDTARYCKSL